MVCGGSGRAYQRNRFTAAYILSAVYQKLIAVRVQCYITTRMLDHQEVAVAAVIVTRINYGSAVSAATMASPSVRADIRSRMQSGISIESDATLQP